MKYRTYLCLVSAAFCHAKCRLLCCWSPLRGAECTRKFWGPYKYKVYSSGRCTANEYKDIHDKLKAEKLGSYKAVVVLGVGTNQKEVLLKGTTRNG